ncbi:NAD(P)-dependent oxidoreductase [Mesorhizobium australicum]|uniref:3-hydroxyisobutyrate dehydrogenase n=1 Tax=Mesorhizobium australicum TaxID=536018 RepID=A0A1X7PSB3_9HYPH|nr:NAD(P)-dependent oxidoreductase [Mesorhizobium australicum]SMH54103.1 3-hydroxyisobutyrate dehydrogenase [Mesorhizobium australicum]
MTGNTRIGFIGLGAMGEPMAARLTAAGFALSVNDADAARTSRVAAANGATAAASPAELAANSDILVTMLPSSAIVSAVLEGPSGALAGLAKGSLIVDMSSGVPEMTRTLAEAAAAKGVAMIDAPVSGGVSRAKTGDLAIMAGGDAAAIDRAEPALKAMGSSIIRTGPIGSAHAMKALNNLVSAGGFLIGIEALLIGQRFGLDPALMVDVLNVSTGMNNSTQKKFKQFVLSRKFDAGFGLDLMVKDLGIALGVANATATPAPFSGLCRDVWAGAQKYLGPGQDHTAVAKFSELIAGSTLGEDDR